MTRFIFACFAGAAILLAAGWLFSRCRPAAALPQAQGENGPRRGLAEAAAADAATLRLGRDNRLTSVNTASLEQDPGGAMQNEPTLGMGTATYADPAPMASGPLDALLATRQWLNTQPLHAQDVRGKVVLVNFWTYSCINSLRMLPYTRAWAEKYKDRGLVVIGVQTPEFAFEHDISNVKQALVSLGVTYPVAIDNDYRIWRAFHNHAWPALYFIGANGRVRRYVFGEGGYDRSERLIQQLLSETGGGHVPTDLVAVSGKGPQAAADDRNLRSFETYIGYEKASYSASPGSISEDTSRRYRAVSELPLNQWSLAGVWTIGGEFATLNESPGRITYRFHARDLHLVLARSSQGSPIRFRVKIDGAPPGADHGVDVDADGWGSVQEDRMYQLVRQRGSVLDRTFEIEFFDVGVRAYAFTFG